MDDEYAMQRLAAIADELSVIRDRICDPKTDADPRCLGLSQAVSGIKRAQEGIRAAH